MSDQANRNFDWASFADGLMAAGDQLAEQLRNPRSRPESPWTEQILEEWTAAKDIVAVLPDAGAAPLNQQQKPEPDDRKGPA